MPRGSSKSTATIQRLLEERRQYQAWLARLSSAADGTAEHVLARVRSDYEARLAAVTEELKAHVEDAHQALEQKKQRWSELHARQTLAAEKLTESELRHAVGEYDEAQWSQVHKDILAELVSVRAELQSVEADIQKLEELQGLLRGKPARATPPPSPPPPLPPPQPSAPSHAAPSLASPSFQPAPPSPRASRPSMPGFKSGASLVDDELEFIKSVTEDDKGGAPSPRRASGEQFQPVVPTETPQTPSPVRAANPVPPPVLPEPKESAGETQEPERTLRCRQCGTLNPPTEWYCEQCGFELAAV